MKFDCIVREIYTRKMTVEANSEDEAMEYLERTYESGVINLSRWEGEVEFEVNEPKEDPEIKDKEHEE
jgi:hypothetical protein